MRRAAFWEEWHVGSGKAYHLGQYGRGIKSATAPGFHLRIISRPLENAAPRLAAHDSNETAFLAVRNISRNSSPASTSHHWSFSFRTPAPHERAARQKRLRRSDSLADLQPGGRIASPNFSKQRLSMRVAFMHRLRVKFPLRIYVAAAFSFRVISASARLGKAPSLAVTPYSLAA